MSASHLLGLQGLQQTPAWANLSKAHSMLRLDATQKKRCLGFDFKFKKIGIKQAIFITDIFRLSKNKFEVFFRCFFKVF
jgi:hypothetical protein